MDELVQAGFRAVSVLDLPDAEMAISRKRLGTAATETRWIAVAVLSWKPPDKFDVWHDRAVLHFLTESDQQANYMKTLRPGLWANGLVVIGAFAGDGPERCSCLSAQRCSPGDLSAFLGTDYQVLP